MKGPESGGLILKVTESFIVSWNNHDARNFASLFAEDAVLTNVVGEIAKGRHAIEMFHEPLFRSIFKDSRLSAEDVQVRVVDQDVSSVDLIWGLAGVLDPNGNLRPPRRGIINFLLTREDDGSWRIKRMQNLVLPDAAI